MPVVKPIAGHTSVRGVYSYLQKNDRALAVDLYNLSWDEDRDAELDQDLKQGVDWAAEMDLTRAANGNDAPWRGKKARTYMHFVVSPDPKDRVTLGQLRELTRAWIRENWGDYECAAVFHDDNANEVMHAHVVVNNTNLATGRRFQNPDPRAMQASIQRLAEERGLSFFVDESREEGEGPAPARAAKGPKTRQAVYVRRAEREIAGKGGYSWVADIRNRVQVAKRCSSSERDFRQALGAMGVEVADASAKGGRADWLYSLAGEPSKKVRGESLGLAYGRKAVEAAMSPNPPARPDKIAAIAARAVELGGWRQLEALAGALELQARLGIRCVADYDARISTMRRRGDAGTAERLLAAKSTARDLGLLPDSAPEAKAGPKRQPCGRPPQRGDGRTRAEGEQAAMRRQLQQQQDRQRERRERGGR